MASKSGTTQPQMSMQDMQEMLKAIFNVSGVEMKHNFHQSHGKTVGEMKELHRQQQSGDVDMCEGNIDTNYEFPEHDKHLVHVKLEQTRFDPVNGKRLSTPQVQKFYPEDFKRMKAVEKSKGNKNPQKAFAHYNIVEVLHDPERKAGEDYDRFLKSIPEPVDQEVLTTKKTAVEQSTATDAEKIKSYSYLIENISKLPEEELPKIYKEVTGNDADPDTSTPMLIAGIIDFSKTALEQLSTKK